MASIELLTSKLMGLESVAFEAQMLMKVMNNSYGRLETDLKQIVDVEAKKLGVQGEKAAKLADSVLHVVASQQKQAMSSTKKLVDHLVEAGRRAVPLEKRAEKEVFQEVQEEEKHLLEDQNMGDALPTGGGVQALFLG